MAESFKDADFEPFFTILMFSFSLWERGGIVVECHTRN